jgi:hypothetical protein
MDAFGRLYESMRRAGAAGASTGALRLRLGTVLSADPLKVDVAGTTQEAEHFYISARLLQDHTETVNLDGGSGSFTGQDEAHTMTLTSGTFSLNGTTLNSVGSGGWNGTVDLTGGSGSFSATDASRTVSVGDGSLTMRKVTLTVAASVLKVGDLVLLLTDNDQIFYLIDKVVKLG